MVGERQPLQMAIQLFPQCQGDILAGHCAQTPLKKGEYAIEQIQPHQDCAHNP